MLAESHLPSVNSWPDFRPGATDSPLKTSEGINKLTGTRNAPWTMPSSAEMQPC